MIVSDELTLAISNRSLSLLRPDQQGDIEELIDAINNAHFNMPAKHYNLSMIDARWALKYRDMVYNELRLTSDMYQALNSMYRLGDGQHYNENMKTRQELAKIQSRAGTFMQYIKNIKELNDRLINVKYGNDWQIVRYAEYFT